MSLLSVFGNSYPVVQINGQKIIGPCENWEKMGVVPNETKEIFINRIPHNLTEIELLPIFGSIGPIWKFRLMMNFSGQNRGFAYLQYVVEEHHEEAIRKLNGRTYIAGYTVNIMMSRNIRTLIMGGVDLHFNEKLVLQNIQTLVNARDLWIVRNNKGYPLFVLNFFNHRDAALSRRTLLQYISAFGNRAWVCWAHK